MQLDLNPLMIPLLLLPVKQGVGKAAGFALVAGYLSEISTKNELLVLNLAGCSSIKVKTENGEETIINYA